MNTRFLNGLGWTLVVAASVLATGGFNRWGADLVIFISVVALACMAILCFALAALRKNEKTGSN